MKCMPRQSDRNLQLFRYSYRGVTLGRHSGYRWAAWHATAGWMDAGAKKAEAESYVDHLLDRAAQ
jgi:hypothetical protein